MGNGLSFVNPEGEGNTLEDVETRIRHRGLRGGLLGGNPVRSADWVISSPSPRPGDGILRRISAIAWHHGIYLGSGRVCHRTAVSPPVEISMIEFLSGQETFQVISYRNDSEEARADTVQIARMALADGRFQINNTYCLRTNNCEHFSTYCRTGVKISLQVGIFATLVSLVFSDVGLTAATSAYSSNVI